MDATLATKKELSQLREWALQHGINAVAKAEKWPVTADVGNAKLYAALRDIIGKQVKQPGYLLSGLTKNGKWKVLQSKTDVKLEELAEVAKTPAPVGG